MTECLLTCHGTPLALCGFTPCYSQIYCMKQERVWESQFSDLLSFFLGQVASQKMYPSSRGLSTYINEKAVLRGSHAIWFSVTVWCHEPGLTVSRFLFKHKVQYVGSIKNEGVASKHRACRIETRPTYSSWCNCYIVIFTWGVLLLGEVNIIINKMGWIALPQIHVWPMMF